MRTVNQYPVHNNHKKYILKKNYYEKLTKQQHSEEVKDQVPRP